MNLQTVVQIHPYNFRISHQDHIMMLGSCFAENLFSYMQDSGFMVDGNPFGILYNPESITFALQRLLRPTPYTENDLFEHQGIFHSFDHHSRFSDVSAKQCLTNINQRLNQSSVFLEETTLFIITFGTAYVYYGKENKVVSNCHKMPDKHFIRSRLSVDTITKTWCELIAEIQENKPEAKFLFTVSPIRHWKDGAHENQLNKAILLLATEQICRQLPQCYYFPSYEIMMDELRDYRFYADDMLHPSPMAIQYIRGKFSASFFDKATLEKVKDWQKLNQALQHKPFNPDSEEYKQFQANILSKVQQLKGKNVTP